MKIAFYGSSLLSSYWNGAATYYRGMLRDLARRGYDITFYEPDAFDRQKHRDIEPPSWADVRVYPATEDGACAGSSPKRRAADIVVKASGVGVFDDELLDGVIAASRPEAIRIFWDVDAPATLAELRQDPDHPLHRAMPVARSRADLRRRAARSSRLTRVSAHGAACRSTTRSIPTTHHPVPPEARFAADLAFLGNRLPDREARVEEFFLRPGRATAGRRFPHRRQRLGDQGHAGQRAPHRPRLHARSQRLQHARRWRCSTSPATAWRRPASRRRPACSRPPAPAPA